MGRGDGGGLPLPNHPDNPKFITASFESGVGGEFFEVLALEINDVAT